MCRSKTASLLIIERQIRYHSLIDHRKLFTEHKKILTSESEKKTKKDFDRLLKRMCANNSENLHSELFTMLNNDLHDVDLQQILFENIAQYSNCEW